MALVETIAIPAKPRAAMQSAAILRCQRALNQSADKSSNAVTPIQKNSNCLTKVENGKTSRDQHRLKQR